MKHENWYNEEYMATKRQEVVDTAQSYLDGKIDFLSAIRDIVNLKHQVSDDDFYPDFTFFVAVDSETDHLPSRDLRAKCA